MSEGTAPRVPPHNEEAEKSVLGSMLLNAECVDTALSSLQADDFYHPAHQNIFSTMRVLSNEGTPVDLVTVSTRMEQDKKLPPGGLEYLMMLAGDILSPANIVHHIRLIKEKAALRKLISVCMMVANECYAGEKKAADIIAKAGDQINKIAEGNARGQVIHIEEAINQAYAAMSAAVKNKGHIMGIRTGFPTMDSMLAGLQKDQLIVIAGRPGMGKTSFALNIVHHASLSQNTTCLIYSLEMSAEQLATRLLTSEAHVDMQLTRTGRMGSAEIDRIALAVESLSGAPIYVDDSANISVTEMLAKARSLKHREKNLGMIVIDYLQLMSSGARTENRNQEISSITRSLKIMAKELGVPIVLLSQLSRAGEKDGNRYPKLSELRESGAIEQDADVVIFLQRDDYYVENQNPETIGKAKIIIAKQRNGPTGAIDVQWNGEYTRYMEVDTRFGQDDQSMPPGEAIF